MTLYEKWIKAKEEETAAIARRRAIEDEIAKKLNVPEDWEGSYTLKEDGFKVNIKKAFTRKVDDKKLAALANEFGLQEYLPVLFRWKPEVDMKKWKEADAGVTNKLAQAITTTPNRIGIKIEIEEE